MKNRHAAIIRISSKNLLNWLQFEGGTIHNIQIDSEHWNPEEIRIVVEHSDLYEVHDGDMLLTIQPLYLDHTIIGEDGKQYNHIERIKPPRKEKENGE